VEKEEKDDDGDGRRRKGEIATDSKSSVRERGTRTRRWTTMTTGR
jgi:hypothetical protein